MTAYILNLIDLACTQYALRSGARELNPFMQGEAFRLFYKIVVVGLLCAVLARSDKPLAKIGLRLCTAAFALVDLWHVVILLRFA